MSASRISRFSLTSFNCLRLAAFYEQVLGFVIEGHAPPQELTGLFGRRGQAVRLRLGQQRIEILEFDLPGKQFPAEFSANSTMFQHFAIVTADIAEAYRRLQQNGEWQPLSRSGPERLPRNTGGVTAFKFRDPEGHPLELLSFPPVGVPDYWEARASDVLFLGIDHSAITVADMATSIAFYRRLGFRVDHRSRNQGEEQERLDDVCKADVQVARLVLPRSDPPCLELLAYSQTRSSGAWAGDDLPGTRIVLDWTKEIPAGATFAGTGRGLWRASLRDPNGHEICLTSDPRPDLGQV